VLLTSGKWRMGPTCLVAALSMAGCGPSRADVEAGIQRQYTGGQVVAWSVGEGDSDHAYVHVEFLPRASGQRCTAVVGFARREGGWQPFANSAGTAVTTDTPPKPCPH
jgi:hypothetical protein